MKKTLQLMCLLSLVSATTACAQPVNKESVTLQDAIQQTPRGNPTLPIQAVADAYRLRYKLNDVYAKATDNHGDKYENLYGTRNFRVVLHGVYYRGGANNVYNREGVRSNSNPLPANGLDNLCREDFSTAIYYYPTNFSTAPKVTNCRTRSDLNNSMNYMQISVLGLTNYDGILSLIYSRIKGQLKGPIYGHCWNGWHASGLAAAVTLKQFCGYTDDQAVAYWIKNTDGDSNYPAVIKKVREFKPVEQYKISADEAKAICP